MENNNRLYLEDRINNGINLNIVFLSHNAYWGNVLLFHDIHQNFNVHIGSGPFDIDIDTLTIDDESIDNFDLLVLRGRGKEFSMFEFNKMKEIAHRISAKSNKQVTIAYSYMNPNYKKIDWHDEFIIEIVKITENKEDNETLVVTDLHPLQLISYALMKHDDVTYPKGLKRLPANNK